MKKSEKKKGQKSAAKPVAATAIIAVIAATIIGILGHFGIGFGDGTGTGENDAVQADATVSETVEADESETAISSEVVTYIDITVSENDYLYQNRTLALDELITEMKSSAADSTVRIYDENASQKAYSELISALEENSFLFIEEISE